jgi:hypothetical protein
MLTGQTQGWYKVSCGIEYRTKTFPEDVTSWASRLTCPLCWATLNIHERITSVSQMTRREYPDGRVWDLDDPEYTKLFHFAGYAPRFRWPVGFPTIYIYDYPESTNPCQAWPVSGTNMVQVRNPTIEDARVGARAYLQRCIDMFGADKMSESYRPVLPTLGVSFEDRPPPKAPDGPHCDKCLKPEEGDCIASPDDPSLLRCMTCYVKGLS